MADDQARGPGTEEPDLFRPTVEQDIQYDPPPWNIGSQVYVAFFGGVVAITAVSYLNALRLHAGVNVARRFLMLGAAALVAVILISYFLGETQATPEDARSYVRLGSRAVAVLLHFVFASQLKLADRRFQLSSGEYQSLWGPGFTAVAIGGILQAILLFLVVGTG